MPARVLSYKSALLKLLMEPSYSRCRVLAHPLTAAHAPVFEARRVEGVQVVVLEIEHAEACTAAQARIDVADIALNVSVSKVASAILILTNNDMSNPMFTTLFHGKTPGELKKIKGIDKARTVNLWVESLQQSPHPVLQALAPEVLATSGESLAAFAARDVAQQRMRDFRNVGARRQWVDQLNATRKEIYGQLAKLPHEHVGLPSDFADQFFKLGPERAEDEEEQEEPEEETLEQLQARLTELREAVAAVEAQIAERAAAAIAAREASARRAAREAQLAELTRAAEELEKQRAALAAELEAEAA